jgi:hypothetical protein
MSSSMVLGDLTLRVRDTKCECAFSVLIYVLENNRGLYKMGPIANKIHFKAQIGLEHLTRYWITWVFLFVANFCTIVAEQKLQCDFY